MGWITHARNVVLDENNVNNLQRGKQALSFSNLNCMSYLTIILVLV